jgi:hypothetical protein
VSGAGCQVSGEKKAVRFRVPGVGKDERQGECK